MLFHRVWLFLSTILCCSGNIRNCGLYSSTAAEQCPKGNLEINDAIIAKEQFYECRSIRSVTLTDSVQEIGYRAFYLCVNLQTIKFGNSIEIIRAAAFAECYELKSVKIPKSVRVIEYCAFAWCTSLIKIGVHSDNEFFVEKSGGLIEVTPTYSRFIQCPGGKEGEFRVPQFVSVIDTEAFAGCEFLTSIKLPDGITDIGNYLFLACYKLETVNFPETFEIIPVYTFYECLSLKEINLGPVTAIGDCAFYGCSSIKSLSIPATCTYIGSYAFYKMNSLVSLDFQNCVAVVGMYAFGNCFSLKSPVGMSHLTSIGAYAFYQCSALESVVVGDQITTIQDRVFAYCSALSDILIGETLTEIGLEAFASCLSLPSLHLPKSLSKIGSYCFAMCPKLEIDIDPLNEYYSSDGGVVISLLDSELIHFSPSRTGSYDIPNSITSLAAYGFEYSSLSSVFIPKSVTKIGMACFSNCYHLESVTVDAENEYFKSVNGIVFSKSGSVLVVFPGIRKGKYDVSDSVSELIQGVFRSCQLEYITVPDSITAIPRHAFSWSSSLKSVSLGNRMKSIGASAFVYCTSLTSITIPDSVVSIEGAAFAYSGITSIVIPDSVNSIEANVFCACESLESVVLGESVQSIGQWAFGDCHSLRTINIPNPVREIGPSAFYRTFSLSSVVLGDKVSIISDSAFQNSGLTYIYLPSSLTEVGAYAFQNCSNLEIVNFTGTEQPEQAGTVVLLDCHNLRSVFVPANYDGDTLFGFPVTKDIDDDELAKSNRKTKQALIILLACTIIFGVVEFVTNFINSHRQDNSYSEKDN